MFEFGLLKGASLNLVEADGVDEELGAQHPKKLAHIEFRDENFLVALQNISEIAGEWVQMAQVQMADFAAFFALFFHGLGYGAEGGAPGNQEQVAFGIAGGMRLGMS